MSVRYLSAVFAFFAVALHRTPLAADPYVPEQLKPWVSWVEQRTPERVCAVLGQARECRWPGELRLVVTDTGATFDFAVRLDARQTIVIPGGSGVWPLEVTAQGGNLRVIPGGDLPTVTLPAGEHTLRGEFRWEKMPEALFVPPDTGRVDLQLLGEKIENPRVSPRGELWLKRAVEKKDVSEEDSLRLEVHRKLEDGIPFRVITHLELSIAGRSREIILGNVTLPGSTTIRVTSPLPYRISSQDQLVVQGRPGIHQIYVESLLAAPPETLSTAKSLLTEWPEEEIWSWVADEALRSVSLDGAAAIDPARTSVPAEWQSLPAYLMTADSKLGFVVSRKGEETLQSNTLSLQRTFWLDLDGEGFTVRDSISGLMRQGWRLNMGKDATLGRVSIDGSDQLITTLPESQSAGIEIRKEALNIEADSRLAKVTTTLNAVGWDHAVNSLGISLALPPGWTLFEASGADRVQGGWLSRWTLLDFFLVILISVATFRLIGFIAAVLMATLLVLSQDQAGAPFQVWFHLLAGWALLRVVPENFFKKFVRGYFVCTLFFLVLIIIRFVISQVQGGLFPQLNIQYVWSPLGLAGDLGGIIIGFATAALFLGTGVMFVYFLIKSQVKKAFFALFLGGVALCTLPLFSALNSVRQESTVNNYANEFQPMTRTAPVPSAGMVPQAMEGILSDADDSDSYGNNAYSRSRRPLAKKSMEKKIASLQQVDPGAALQTGPGVPSWSWRRWHLTWNGPVDRDQVVELYLISPFWNLVLSLVRTMLAVLLLLIFIRLLRARVIQTRAAGTAAAVIALMVLMPALAEAQSYPGEAMLSELEQRLYRDDCTEQCTSAQSLNIVAQGSALTLTARVTSRGSGAWPLPGPLAALAIQEVKLNDAITIAVRRDTNGFMWVRIPDGTHTVTAKALLPNRRGGTVQFAVSPRHVQVSAPGWEVDGVSATGSIGSSIEFVSAEKENSRTPDSSSGNPESEEALPEWFSVQRSLDIGIPWTVTTTVRRLGSSERSQLFRAKLLPGESVTSQDTKVEQGHAILNFPRGVEELSWSSLLGESPTLALHTDSGERVTESWELRCSAIFRCDFKGATPLSTLTAGQNVVNWLPWPGERVDLSFERPAAVKGETITIDNAQLDYSPGTRLLDAKLALTIRSSQGGWQQVNLPEGASVRSVMVNNSPAKVQPKDHQVALPLTPGVQQYVIDWNAPFEFGIQAAMPPVRIDHEVNNLDVSVSLPQDRWVLYASGPDWGPVFIYWGQLLLILIAAVLLGRSRLTPLGIFQWTLLGLGLSGLPVLLLVIPPLWFIALHFRKRNPLQHRWAFNLGQLGLVGLTLVTLLVLFGAVAYGLTGSPDMAIEGYNSTNSVLRWYTDRIGGETPEIIVYSLPLWVWRIFMFTWASWLVIALLSWLKLGWESFSEQGLWRADEAKEAPPATPAE